MNYFELEKDEEELINSFDRGEFRRVPKKDEEVKHLQVAAHTALNRTKNINIRLSERDLLKLKARAAEKGIPYQTLVASVLHQYTGKSS
jgi:predicted DNA binding CopG/RHH family protein